MLNGIHHRGPDRNDFWIEQKSKLVIANTRLAIQDLSVNGNQPMHSKSGRYVIVFNGEIYNSSILRNKIDTNKLVGNSDTEVLVNYFEKYNEKSLENIDGMFSFVVFDFEKKNCLIARDRFGIKPLYYYNDDDFLLVSSEIKPILDFKKKSSYNENCFGDFFFKGHMDHGENTFFNDIKSLFLEQEER